MASDTSGDNVDGTTNIIPRMNPSALREGHREIMRHIYTPKHYYRRVRTFMKEYKTPPVRASLSLGRLLAVLRSAVRLGILGPERVHYWCLMAWTLTHRPSLFPLAVTLAIYGHHFRKVCELHLH